MIRQYHWSSKSTCCSIVSWSKKPLVEAIGHDLVEHNLSINWSCSALISRVTIAPSDSNSAWMSSAPGNFLCWRPLKFSVVTSRLLILFTFTYFSLSSLFDMFLFFYPSDLSSLCTSELFSCYIVVPGAGMKSVNTGVVIGNKLDNQIFELSQLAPWEIGTRQLCL